MNNYGNGLGDIDNDTNLLLLRLDLRKYFNKRWLVIVLKVTEARSRSS